MSSRSLRVAPEYLEKVKSTVKRNNFPSQKALALELGIARSTVSNFLNGKPVDFLNFTEICEKLGVDWQAIAHTPEKEKEAEKTIYIKRPPIESICDETILQPGSLIRIQAPKKMGKTWLINRVLEQAKRYDYQTASIDLLAADTADFQDLDKFLWWFCSGVSRELNVPKEILDEYWDEKDSSKVNCQIYFEEYLLSKVPEALVLCIDKIDLIFPYPIAQDFLGLLRSWYEKAKRKNLWKKLRLVVVHPIEVYIPLDTNQSPFNVGMLIELPEFNLEQVSRLTETYELKLQAEEVKQLTDVVGGHPFLLDQALSYLINHQDLTLSELLEKAPTNAGIYRSHLQELLSILEANPELKAAFKKVVMATESVNIESLLTYKLYSLGLVKLVGNDVVPRCELYRQYFNECL
ncbi:MAG: helix-turn-helix domain-containing protein [Okeania sp. SIO3I5]|uniref:AAA-like domain-containing protein n=1 Tax=Okeania sp. SIO3I5 TaxID=2607805 RepID=UPI0013BDF046|nr:AAA-like domain-containing protein [Okeania sp. SIO3I5]NEQ40459.1 helix-turn-helix domain-containing protein [Okeania sp. SIO3I5]